MLQPTEAGSVDIRIRVVGALWQNPGLSRMELAQLLDIDKSTLSRSTGRLLDSGKTVNVDVVPG